MCPWDRDTLEYDGLCLHNPLSESPSGDFTLSAEQLEAQAAEYAEKRKNDKRKRKAERKKSDPVAYNAQNNQYRMDAYNRTPEASRQAENRLATKDVESKKYYCAVCDHAFQRNKDLRAHNSSKRHLFNVASQDIPEDQKYFCALCDRNPGSTYALKRHKAPKMHLENAVAAAAKQQQ